MLGCLHCLDGSPLAVTCLATILLGLLSYDVVAGRRMWCRTCRSNYEEGPPTLTDLLIRDRRWCQGNL